MSDKVVNVPLFYSVRDGGANEVRGGSKDFTMGEIIREACSIGDAINAITEIVAIKKQDRFCDCEYYFRGENHNFLTEDGAVPDAHVPTTLYRDKGFVENEHLIFNEIVRTYPDVFRDDKTTFEMLARMQHYYFPTRLMDITSNVMVAMAFSVVKGVNAAKDFLDVPGFIHIYAAKRSKIKYSTGDTVSGICAMVKVPANRIRGKKLQCVAYEAQKERPGFDRYHDCGDTAVRFDADRRKVWCVKSVINNNRIKVQSGDFFLFGCEDNKMELDATFREDDYGKRGAATEYMARVGVVKIMPKAKGQIHKNLQYLGVGLERLYPEFTKFNEYIYENYSQKGK